jgi:acyl-CoA synthetase (NDP forming)
VTEVSTTHLERVFSPSAIAVVGASDDADKIGGKVLRTLMRHNYAGKLYPVNPSRSTVAGLKAYTSVASIGMPVDLALIAVPAAAVPYTLQECALAGIPGAVIFSSGFADAGDRGAGLQQQLDDICRRTGIRVSGPNSEGFLNVRDKVAATFSPAINIEAGDLDCEAQIGIVAQSGGLGFAFFNRGRRDDLIFNYVFSVGNQVDLEIAEYLEFLIGQSRTKVVLMYVESLKDPALFLRTARRAADLGKPIVLVKVGTSKAGRRAAESHTGAIAGSLEVSSAVFAHHGIVCVDDQDGMLDFAAAFIHNPLPKGNRVAIISASGGTAVWLADACEAAGFELPEIDAGRRAQLEAFIPFYGSTTNPVDITAQGTGGYSRSMEILGQAPYIDTLIIAVSFAQERRLIDDGQAIADIARKLGKPVLIYSYTVPSEASRMHLRKLGLHCFASLQGCVRSLQGLWTYAQFQQTRRERDAPARSPDMVPPEARHWLDAPGGALCEYEAKAMLAAYDVPVPREALARDADDAVASAGRMVGPVALKLQSPEIPHKTEAGAVKLGVHGEAAVRAAFEQVMANGRRFDPKAQVRGVLVQPMASPGLELIAGVINDPDFGPMVMVGLGGIYVEILGDVALAPAPLNAAAALAMLERLRGRRLLEGVRGEAQRDKAAIVDLLVRLSHLAWDFRHRLAEFDVNPVFLHEQGHGLTVVDALGILKPIEEGKTS